MDLQALLASILNPGGTQQAIPQMAVPQVGDHNNPALLQQAIARFQQPQQAPQPPQQSPAPQARPSPQNAPVPAPGSNGGGLGILGDIFAPRANARNVTRGWLQKQGLDEGTATIVASNPQALQLYVSQKLKGAGGTDFDQRAAAAQQFGLTDPEQRRNFILTGNLPEARGGAAEVSLNTIPGVDEQGNAVLIQVDKAGVAHKTQMPAGVKISKPPLVKDTGTEFQVIDPVTREIVQTIPKNVAGAAAEEARGKAQGGAAFDLPRIEQNAQQTLDDIDALKNDPGRETATGLSGTLDPRNYLAGTDATNFRTRLDQLKGQTFLQAYQMLKGGGQITEIEGTKAENAIARLNTAQSDEAFSQALDDFRSVIQKGLERAKQQAGASYGAPQSAPQKAPTGAPASGDTPPASYTGKNWKYLTPEQRKLWQ